MLDFAWVRLVAAVGEFFCTATGSRAVKVSDNHTFNANHINAEKFGMKTYMTPY
jgi:hypothetical protein